MPAPSEPKLLFASTTEMVVVPAGALVFVEADGNYSMLHTADGSQYVLTMQLGQVEMHLFESLAEDDLRFVRLGRGLIVNRDFVALINYPQQRLVLSDCRKFKYELRASREALKALKDLTEEEIKP